VNHALAQTGLTACTIAWLAERGVPLARHARTGVPVTLASLVITAAWFVL
jgi:hypothetical protein